MIYFCIIIKLICKLVELIPNDFWRSGGEIIPQLAFFVNLHRAVIGPSATLTGRWRPDIDLRRMLTGPLLFFSLALAVVVFQFSFHLVHDYVLGLWDSLLILHYLFLHDLYISCLYTATIYPHISEQCQFYIYISIAQQAFLPSICVRYSKIHGWLKFLLYKTLYRNV